MSATDGPRRWRSAATKTVRPVAPPILARPRSLRLEAWGAASLFSGFKFLPLDCASAFGGALARRIGPFLGVSKHARRNIRVLLDPADAATWDWSWTFYFRTADFFRGADFLRGPPFGGLRASLTALPAWNRTALLAAILMVSPLCGFRPSRAGRAVTLKVPRPETRTASPAARESRIAATTAFTAWPASLVFSSVAWATFSTNSDWFISDLQLHCYETPTLKAKRCKVCARVRSARSPARGSEIVVSSSWFR